MRDHFARAVGRFYRARAHRRTKDRCQFVYQNGADGPGLRTLDDRPMLAINGIQTLSHGHLNLLNELPGPREVAGSRFRLL